MKVTEIDDTFYVIHKLQNQRKYENQKKITKIKIGEILYKDTDNVIKYRYCYSLLFIYVSFIFIFFQIFTINLNVSNVGPREDRLPVVYLAPR